MKKLLSRFEGFMAGGYGVFLFRSGVLLVLGLYGQGFRVLGLFANGECDGKMDNILKIEKGRRRRLPDLLDSHKWLCAGSFHRWERAYAPIINMLSSIINLEKSV